MMHKCSFPGCSVRRYSELGLRLHEISCHSMVRSSQYEDIQAQIQAQCGTTEIHTPVDEQAGLQADLVIGNAGFAEVDPSFFK